MSLNSNDPCDVGNPRASSRSFTPIGTPANGPGIAPGGDGVVDRGGRDARRVLVEHDERVERVVVLGDAAEALVEDLGRLQLTGANRFGNFDGTAHARNLRHVVARRTGRARCGVRAPPSSSAAASAAGVATRYAFAAT